ncbi:MULTISPECIES: UPF0223 family protein [Virgibacillus]|uniref:UPF0223 protein GCM10007111_01280 n=1 Tax=Virgibacillus kapii TaxID=1638645 RepID=A0ABQ2D4K7_9BACI|nr:MULTISPECIES: UPF0223 family protein [Virgibacillus]EQB36556.1 hypothetical protein M948_16110 [Virgibacillus sp. CM-4]MYL42389.1 hypothetical protein [Virgibacillus massiliensis]GGJ42933.1 UPF0223 protein [Virgibacillus kapii]
MNYHYPIDETWSKEEVIQVVQFFSLVEQAYEKKIDRDVFLAAYREFKRIVPSKSEEKKLFSSFEQGSGYSSFQVVKQARNSNDTSISIG